MGYFENPVLLAVFFFNCGMKKDSLSATISKRSENASSLYEVKTGVRLPKSRRISEEKVAEILLEIREKLGEGLSGAAEKIITETLDNYQHTSEHQAKLIQSLSFTYETQGRYQESLTTIEKYDDEELLSEIGLETQISVITQLAISFNNTNDYPKAVALLERCRQLTASAPSSKDAAAAGLQLAYAYLPAGRPHQAAILGEYLTATARQPSAAAKGGLLAVQGYLAAMEKLPADAEDAKLSDRTRAVALATFLDKTYPTDPTTDAVRFRRGGEGASCDVRELAQHVVDGSLDFDALSAVSLAQLAAPVRTACAG